MKVAFCLLIALYSLHIKPSLSFLDALESLPVLTTFFQNPSAELFNLILSGLRSLPFLETYTGVENRNYCGDENFCKDPNFTIPVTEYLVGSLLSPLYVYVLPETYFTVNMDNICYTFFQVNNGTTVIFCISIVFNDGSNDQFCFVDNDGPGVGALRGANPSCTFQVYAIGIQCADALILYRCFLRGPCQQIDTVRDPGFDQVFGVSASPYESDSCKKSTAEYIKSLPEYKTRPNFTELPQKLPYQCVTCLPNNGTAVNMGQFSGNGTSCQSTSSNSSLTNLEQLLALLSYPL